MSEVTVVELSPQRVLGMRRKGAYREIAIMLPRVFEFAFSKNVQIAGYPIFLCHEITHEEVQKADNDENADIEVAVPISGSVEIAGNEEIREYELPGGKMARIVHKGPYEECSPTYEKLFSWIAEKGKRIIGPIREIYFNDPREVPPEEILTEIYAPLD
ncbi:GyrI-like domain-containing protein [Methanosarcina sp. Z-7115]|uniref:GyrI-like domain-containing protein n=1 Tax=Methanosarcina baikalica TaxID=3073890 RepID=A0ABU2D244_9EURY|nr:GyrI-like domain-containing protein [Methanosarcina sp. Z-7115]MDR7666052.1 GyrI-like domain-containing protein [Methanosarcina sp. Z-7115]